MYDAILCDSMVELILPLVFCTALVLFIYLFIYWLCLPLLLWTESE